MRILPLYFFFVCATGNCYILIGHKKFKLFYEELKEKNEKLFEVVNEREFYFIFN